MKTLRMFLTLLAGSASAAFAASGTQDAETGFLVYLFVGFFALIVVSQLIPAVILFVGMVRGVFVGTKKPSVVRTQGDLT